MGERARGARHDGRRGDDGAIGDPARATTSPPRRPTSWSSRCGPRSSCSGPCSPGAGEARVAMPGGDDFGSRPIDMHLARPRGARRHLRAQPTAYIEAPGRPARRDRVRARVPQRRRHREPAHGRRAGQGQHGHRQRGPRARDRRPRRVPQPDGGAGARCREPDGRGRGGRPSCRRSSTRWCPTASRRPRSSRPLGVAGGEITLARHPARPHGDADRQDGDDGHADLPRRATASGRCAGPPASRRRGHPAVPRASPPTTCPVGGRALLGRRASAIVTENVFSGRFRLRGRAGPDGGRHPGRGPPPVVRRRRAPVGCAGAGARHPGRGGRGGGGARGRGRDRRARRPSTSTGATRTSSASSGPSAPTWSGSGVADTGRRRRREWNTARRRLLIPSSAPNLRGFRGTRSLYERAHG